MEETPEATPPQPQGAPSPRRRFLQHGLAGGSVALLASTHRAFAGVSCGLRDYSGYQSAIVQKSIVSGHPTAFCSGLSPGYWYHGGLNSWPSPYTHATLFSAAFGTAPGAPFNANATLLTVVSTTPSTNARQFVAALLDAASDTLSGTANHFPYTVAQVQTLWKTGDQTGLANYFSTYLFV